jgi:hypothetical protein
MPSPSRHIATLLSLAGALCIQPASGRPSAANRSSGNSAAARAIVDRMVRTYSGLNSLQQTSVHTQTFDYGANQRTRTVTVEFAFRRPNRFAYRVSHADAGVSLVCNGRQVWIYSAPEKKYMIRGAPEKMAFVPDVLQQWGSTYLDAFSLLSGVSPYEGVRHVRLAGRGTLRGVPVDIVEMTGLPPRFTVPTGTVRLFIGRADHLLYRSEVRASRTTSPSFRGDPPGRASAYMTKTHSRLQVNRPVPDHFFSFQPPRGAKQVPSL